MSEFGQKLLMAEARAKLKGVDYSSVQISNQQVLQHDSCKGSGDHFLSNEGDLRGFNRYLKYRTQGILGIGSDQALDLLSASGANRALLVDYSPIKILAMRAQLEIGARHVKTFQEYPTPEQFREYFLPENNDQLRRILGSVYSPEQVAKSMIIFDGGIPFFDTRVPFSDFMGIRAEIKQEDGVSTAWYGTAEKLAQVIESYINEDILLSLSNLTDKSHILDMAKYSRKRGFRFDVVYLSNLEEYHPESIWDGLDLLPIDHSAIILKTVIDVNQPISDQIRLHPVISRLVIPFRYVIANYEDRRDFPWLKPTSHLYPDPNANNLYFLMTAR